MRQYSDLGGMPENQRIRAIGEKTMAMHEGQVVGFIVDSAPGVADRYIRKLRKRFPRITIISAQPLTEGTVLVKVGPPQKVH